MRGRLNDLAQLLVRTFKIFYVAVCVLRKIIASVECKIINKYLTKV